MELHKKAASTTFGKRAGRVLGKVPWAGFFLGGLLVPLVGSKVSGLGDP